MRPAGSDLSFLLGFFTSPGFDRQQGPSHSLLSALRSYFFKGLRSIISAFRNRTKDTRHNCKHGLESKLQLSFLKTMSLAQASITSFFRKNEPHGFGARKVVSPEPKLSPSSIASGAGTPSIHINPDRRALSRRLPHAETLVETPFRGVCAQNDSSNDEEKLQEPAVLLKRSKTESIPAERRHASNRRATKPKQSMKEASSDSESDSEINSDDESKGRRVYRRSKAANIASSNVHRRDKSSEIVSVEEISTEKTALEVSHLRYKKPETERNIVRTISATGKRPRQLSPDKKADEESPVLERIRCWKKKSEKQAEVELWNELSRVEAELNDDKGTPRANSSQAHVETEEKLVCTKEQQNTVINAVTADSTYELERIENIR